MKCNACTLRYFSIRQNLAHPGPRCRSRNRGVIIKPRNGGKVRLWLPHFLCESVWCSLCRCQLSFVHFPIFPALYGKCSRRSHWRMHVKDICWNVDAWLEHILEPSGKIRSTFFSAPFSWLLAAPQACGNGNEMEVGNHLLEVKIAMFDRHSVGL